MRPGRVCWGQDGCIGARYPGSTPLVHPPWVHPLLPPSIPYQLCTNGSAQRLRLSAKRVITGASTYHTPNAPLGLD